MKLRKSFIFILLSFMLFLGACNPNNENSGLTGAEKVIEVLSKCDIKYAEGESITSVKSDLEFSKVELYNAVIEWRSSNESVISSDGKVTRPASDTEVTITVKVTIDEDFLEKSFKIKVLKEEAKDPSLLSDKEKVEDILSKCDIKYAAGEDISSVKSNITLSSQRLYDAIIEWSSSDESVISKTGIVTRLEENTEVVIKVKVTVGTESDEKEFKLTVLKVDESPTPEPNEDVLNVISEIELLTNESSKEDVLKVKELYDNLTTDKKEQVTNKEKLDQLLATFAIGSLEAPLSVSEAVAIMEKMEAGVFEEDKKGYVTGKVINASYADNLYTLTLVDENDPSKTMQVYKGACATDITLVSVNDVVVAYGYFQNFHPTYVETSTYELSLYNEVAPKILKTTKGTSTIAFSGENVSSTDLVQSATNGSEVSFTLTVTEGYTINLVTLNGLEISANEGVYKFVVDGDCTIKALGAKTGAKYAYQLLTDSTKLKIGDMIIIAAKSKKITAVYAMGTVQAANNRDAVEIELDENGRLATVPENVQVFTLEKGTKDNTFALSTGTGYIYAASSSSNYLKTQTELDDNASWLISYTEGAGTIVAQGTNTRNIIKLNESNSSRILFACYSQNQVDVVIYVYSEIK